MKNICKSDICRLFGDGNANLKVRGTRVSIIMFGCDVNIKSIYKLQFSEICTVWKVSKYGGFSGRYFAVFSPNKGKYGPEKTQYLETFHAVVGLFADEISEDIVYLILICNGSVILQTSLKLILFLILLLLIWTIKKKNRQQN